MGSPWTCVPANQLQNCHAGKFDSKILMASHQAWTNRIGALAVGLGLAMSVVIVPCWWSIFRDHNPICSQNKPDFISLYTGAVLASTDRAALYDLERQRRVQQPIDPSRGDWVLPFFYPPFFALFLAPLSALSFSTAFALMTLFNFILLAIALQVLLHELDLNRHQVRWLLLATFCNYGVLYALLEAQTSFIALTLFALFVSTLNSPAKGKAGTWSGLMFFKPQLALVPLIILIARRRWLAILLTMGVLGTMVLLTFFVMGLQGLEHYLTAAREAWSADSFLHIMRPEQPERMHNLRGLAYYFFPAPWREYVWQFLALAVIAMIANQCIRHESLSYSAWLKILVGLILVTPHLHDHDTTLLILPAAFLLKLGGDEVPAWVALTLVVAGFLPLLNTLAYPHLPPLIPLAGMVYLLAEARQLLKPVR